MYKNAQETQGCIYMKHDGERLDKRLRQGRSYRVYVECHQDTYLLHRKLYTEQQMMGRYIIDVDEDFSIGRGVKFPYPVALHAIYSKDLGIKASKQKHFLMDKAEIAGD